MKRGGIKRKADEVGSNVKTPPSSPQAKHLDKKQNQNNIDDDNDNDNDDDNNETTQETSLQKIDEVLNDNVCNNRDRLSPSPEKVIDEKIEKKTRIPNSTLDDKKRTIKKLFLTEMPLDFYQFYEFCKANSKVDPTLAFKIVNLKLVGPFDIMSEQLTEIQDHDNYLRHWRYFYDPPEFQVSGQNLFI